MCARTHTHTQVRTVTQHTLELYFETCDDVYQETWDRYKLKDAALVVSCVAGGLTSKLALAPKLKDHGVPFLVGQQTHQHTKLSNDRI